jgi:hypothetical protein
MRLGYDGLDRNQDRSFQVKTLVSVRIGINVDFRNQTVHKEKRLDVVM